MLGQRSFEELGAPLSSVTFCVVDLETTGGSPLDDAITEVGALKVRCGEVVGTFQSLVNPGRSVPAYVRLLTGISDALLVEAPPIESVLPAFLEFAGGSVLVAHNARFDTGFLNRALEAGGYDRLSNTVIDTALLARKVLAGEVRDAKLATLARHLRCAHQPVHRAFADVLATTDVLHHLIERVAGYGINTLEDLCAFSASRVDGTFEKIRLADGLPSRPGVYRFVGPSGKTLYVGKATDLRTRVRSYFYGDPRRKIRDLLRETASIRAEPHATTLEAEVAEVRAIQEESPPYNRAGRAAARWYLKVAGRPVIKLSPCRVPKSDGALYVGPFSARKVVCELIDALRDTVAIHRCGRPEQCTGCAFADLGTCRAHSPDPARRDLHLIAGAFAGEVDGILDLMVARMRALAAQDRFEEAAAVRDRGALFERSILGAVQTRALVDAGDIVLRVDDRAVLIRDGQLAAATTASDDVGSVLTRLRETARSREVGAWLDAATARETRVIEAWLRRTKSDVRILHTTRGWAVHRRAAPSPRFRPATSSRQRNLLGIEG
jgi:DNA polymerase III subunit epsilon